MTGTIKLLPSSSSSSPSKSKPTKIYPLPSGTSTITFSSRLFLSFMDEPERYIVHSTICPFPLGKHSSPSSSSTSRILSSSSASHTHDDDHTDTNSPTISLSTYIHHRTKHQRDIYFLNLADWLKYVPFSNDFGPFNIAQVWKFREFVNQYIKSEEFEDIPLCIITSPDPEEKANAICLLGLYAVLEMGIHPGKVMGLLEGQEIKAFRDASDGYSPFHLSIQDILFGAYRGSQLCKTYHNRKGGIENWIDLNGFDRIEYEFYEMVMNGDLNILGPFIAFASPVDKSYRAFRSRHEPPSSSSTKNKDDLSKPFRNVLKYFESSKVKMVVRLNGKLYDKKEFESRGMKHVEMDFPDGSNPSLDLVRNFIDLADETISHGGKVAVHCKAGLGRTGCMIGAYMIYKYGFSAGEAIGLMRLIRPGMVVGPQQTWLQENASEFSRWAGADEFARTVTTTTVQAQIIESPGKGHSFLNRTPSRKSSVTSLRMFFSASKSVEATVTVKSSESKESCAVTPGQPRKTPGGNRIEKILPSSTGKRSRLSASAPSTPTPVKASKMNHPYNLVVITPRRSKSDRTECDPSVPPVPTIPKQYRRSPRAAGTRSITPSKIPAPVSSPGRERHPLTPSKSLYGFAGDVFGLFGTSGGKKGHIDSNSSLR